MNTVTLKNAAGITTMTVLANDDGSVMEFNSASEAALIAAKIEGASVSKDAMRGLSAAEAKKRNQYGRTNKWKASPFFYRIRVRG